MQTHICSTKLYWSFLVSLTCPIQTGLILTTNDIEVLREKEILRACGKTVWGNPTDIGKVFEGAVCDAVLDNNGKDLDVVGLVDFDSENMSYILNSTSWFCLLQCGVIFTPVLGCLDHEFLGISQRN
ncbi:hypothetical protein RHMOL_Rhmol12G0227100 [Rhododendron molle]|uniref:Uncharacterized protein n=1 Tax=Rhododendron molle TaxID=49168 RepID=A0ACC0LL16_RHOML|nr:hypothetical protein RHMOL_Rhmol12G0227100 [Rhododendron molle]